MDGAVQLTPSGNRSLTGSIALPRMPAFGGASFTVFGLPNQKYSLSLPSSVAFDRQGGTDTLTVIDLLGTPSSNDVLGSGGSATITFEGSPITSGDQTFGQDSGGLNVTVSYQ